MLIACHYFWLKTQVLNDYHCRIMFKLLITFERQEENKLYEVYIYIWHKSKLTAFILSLSYRRLRFRNAASAGQVTIAWNSKFSQRSLWRFPSWDITTCSPVKVNRTFVVKYRLHVRSWRVSQARNQYESRSMYSSACCLLRADFLFDVFFNPEDWCSILLQNSVHFHRTTRCYISEDRTLVLIMFIFT
jgi:hypothetical protein